MSRQDRRQAYHVQLLLNRVLESLGIKLPRMVFRASLDSRDGKPFLKVDVADGERLAAALESLTQPSEKGLHTRNSESAGGGGTGR